VTGIGDVGEGTRAADARDRGEVGPGVSGGERERVKRIEAGRRWGTNTRARAAQRRAAWFKLGLNRNENSNETKLISTSFKIELLQIGPFRAPKI
jgi:hypothetical protein